MLKSLIDDNIVSIKGDIFINHLIHSIMNQIVEEFMTKLANLVVTWQFLRLLFGY